jgi:hypothetical protein
MEKINANVAIDGNIGNVINKGFLTIPELVILRHIHGETSVFNIIVDGSYDHDDKAERDRLGNLYSDQKVVDVFGAYGALPQSFEDARIDDGYFDKMYLQERLAKPKAKSKVSSKRARDNKGHFIADDPETETNEAYEAKEDD